MTEQMTFILCTGQKKPQKFENRYAVIPDENI